MTKQILYTRQFTKLQRSFNGTTKTNVQYHRRQLQTQNIKYSIKAILMKLFLNRFNNNYCLTGIHHSSIFWCSYSNCTFIIRLLHNVTSTEEFLLKKSNQNFLLFTCNTSLKYISCFFFANGQKSLIKFSRNRQQVFYLFLSNQKVFLVNHSRQNLQFQQGKQIYIRYT